MAGLVVPAIHVFTRRKDVDGSHISALTQLARFAVDFCDFGYLGMNLIKGLGITYS
jgi:hypothetical protein